MPTKNRVTNAPSDILSTNTNNRFAAAKPAAEERRPGAKDKAAMGAIAAKLKAKKNGTLAEPIQIPEMLQHTRRGFSPFNALKVEGKKAIVDIDLLRQNLNWEPNIDYKASSDWKPRKIKPFNEANTLNLDIETTGLEAADSRVIMVGFLTEGPFHHLRPEMRDRLSNEGKILFLEEDTDEAEYDLLVKTFDILKLIKAEIISLHNGLNFDLSFLYDRAAILEVPCPIDIDRSRPRYVTSAEDARGEAFSYFATYFTHRNSYGYFKNTSDVPQVLDTIVAAAIDNKISRNYKSFSLKRLVTDHFKLRTEKRKEIPHQLIKEYWIKAINGDDERRSDLYEYLDEDLIDQRYLTRIYGPLIWGQQAFFPLQFQDLLLGSPARKWNALYDDFYRNYYGELVPPPIYKDQKRAIAEGMRLVDEVFWKPIDSDPYQYVGGEVGCVQSLRKNYAKIDVASLYPSLMLRYMLIMIDKDPLCVGLKVLDTARDFRYVLKPLGNGEPERARKQKAYLENPDMFEPYFAASKQAAKGSDGAMKVALNGFFGFTGTSQYNFNMPACAALITGYGRCIMGIMKECIFSLARMVNLDTDGVTFSPMRMVDVHPEFPWHEIGDLHDSKGKIISPHTMDSGELCVNAEWIYAYTQSRLPTGLGIELETNYPAGMIYSYKAKNYAYWKHDNGAMGIIEKVAKKFGKIYTPDGLSVVVTPFAISAVSPDVFSEIGPLVYEDDNGNDCVLEANDGNGKVSSDYVAAAIEVELPDWVELEIVEGDGSFTIKYAIAPDIDPEVVRDYFKPRDFKAVPPADCMGIFTKRNLSQLKKEVTLEYARRLGFYGEACADEYFENVRDKIKEICAKKPEELTHDELMFINIRRKISKAEKKIVEMGVGNPGEVCNHYFGDFTEISAAGKPLKGGVKQTFMVRVEEGEWGELSANPPSQDELGESFDIERNMINFSPSFEIYDQILTEIRDEAHLVHSKRPTTEMRLRAEKDAEKYAKEEKKNLARIDKLKLSDNPYRSLLSEVWAGGDDGAEQAALYAARDAEIDTGGQCANGFIAYDHTGYRGTTPKLKEFGLKENRSDGIGPNKRENVKKSQATIWFGDSDSEEFKIVFEAVAKNNRPWLINPTAAEIVEFVKQHWIEVLNVSGDRPSLNKEIFESVYDVCLEAFKEMRSQVFDPSTNLELEFSRYSFEKRSVVGNGNQVPTVPERLQN